jgi:hypothetical protein
MQNAACATALRPRRAGRCGIQIRHARSWLAHRGTVKKSALFVNGRGDMRILGAALNFSYLLDCGGGRNRQMSRRGLSRCPQHIDRRGGK